MCVICRNTNNIEKKMRRDTPDPASNEFSYIHVEQADLFASKSGTSILKCSITTSSQSQQAVSFVLFLSLSAVTTEYGLAASLHFIL